MAAALLQGCQPAAAETTMPALVNAELECEPVLLISIGDGEGEYSPYGEPVPSFITFDPNGNLYLDDQVNSRLLRYSDFSSPPEVIIIPQYQSEDSFTNILNWLDIVVTNDRIYILHNPAVTPDHHLLISVHDLDGIEINLLDINTFSEISDVEKSQIFENWMLFSMTPDGHGGIYIAFPIGRSYIHIANSYQHHILTYENIGFEPHGYFITGWNGQIYSRNDDEQTMVIDYETGQSTEWQIFNQDLRGLGIENVYIQGTDLEGNTLFISNSGVGFYNPLLREILLSNVALPENSDVEIESADNNLVMAPDGAIYRFDSTNWPESRELLRCEFLPLP
jgi:hypothetical protein